MTPTMNTTKTGEPLELGCSEGLGPVAWMRRHPDGTWTNEVLPNWCIEQVRKDSGAWVPLVEAPRWREVGLEEPAEGQRVLAAIYPYNNRANALTTIDAVHHGGEFFEFTDPEERIHQPLYWMPATVVDSWPNVGIEPPRSGRLE